MLNRLIILQILVFISLTCSCNVSFSLSFKFPDVLHIHSIIVIHFASFDTLGTFRRKSTISVLWKVLRLSITAIVLCVFI